MQKVSLLQELSDDQVRLHPWYMNLLSDDKDQGRMLRENAAARIVNEFENLSCLEKRAQRVGYWECLEQARVVQGYVELLEPEKAASLKSEL